MLIFLKNKVVEGTVPVTVSLDKVQFLKAGSATSTPPGKIGVMAYFPDSSFAVLARFETQEEANGALTRLENEIRMAALRIAEGYEPMLFIEAESWAK